MEAKGFFAALFDYSFRSFITPRIIKILYVLATILVSLWTLLLILAAFNVSSGAGAVMLLVGGPLLFLLGMIYSRVFLELVIVFFRINGNVQEIRDDRGGGAKQPASIPETPLVDAPVIAAAGSPLEVGPEPDATATTVEPSPEVAPAATSPAPEPASPPPPPAPEAASPAPDPASPPPSARFCENCGAERKPGASFCTNCGHA